MSIDVRDLRSTIIPKSDQLNAEQLLGGPMTVTITDVRVGSGDEQPVTVHYEGENGRPYKPCKTMRKVLIHAWERDGTQWVGKSMTLYCDPHVKFGGEAVGGIRISHMSDIPKRLAVALTATRGKKVLYEIEPLKVERGPALDDVLTAIATAHNRATLDAAKALAVRLRDPDEIAEAQDAYRARVAALKAASGTPPPADQPDAPRPTYAEIRKAIEAGTTREEIDDAAAAIEGLPVAQGKELKAIYVARLNELGL